MKKLREVQCSGRIVKGAAKGDRCRRTLLKAVDKNNNTTTWYCVGHVTQKRQR